MKLLLDMYKSAPKEQRDKVQLMAAERKSKAEVCSLECSCLSVLLSLTCNLCELKHLTRKPSDIQCLLLVS